MTTTAELDLKQENVVNIFFSKTIELMEPLFCILYFYVHLKTKIATSTGL